MKIQSIEFLENLYIYKETAVHISGKCGFNFI